MVRIILLCDVYIICCFTVPPSIIRPMEGHEFTITEGSDGSITCTATGYPPPTVVWQNIDSNNRLMSGTPMISPTGVGNVTSVSVELMVTGAMRRDSGMYTCSAINFISSDTTNIAITVHCKWVLEQLCYACVYEYLGQLTILILDGKRKSDPGV